MKAKVFVTLKKSVMDPQGATVKHALDALDFQDVQDVRIGKMIEVSFGTNGDRTKIEAELKEMCDKLLANPVIEDYRWEIEG